LSYHCGRKKGWPASASRKKRGGRGEAWKILQLVFLRASRRKRNAEVYLFVGEEKSVLSCTTKGKRKGTRGNTETKPSHIGLDTPSQGSGLPAEKRKRKKRHEILFPEERTCTCKKFAGIAE